MDSLTLVIPALNEEKAIGPIIERCLAAVPTIKKEAALKEVEIFVVSDGSTDKTPEIAATYTEIETIIFEKNRGYGAAIKEGFRRGSGSIVGFLDADGTCDPVVLGKLCKELIDHRADIVLGSRMHKNSRMPFIRRLGNHFYALLMGLLCGKRITDTASGMRVLRRSSLSKLYPLPDRLHFTPSMSARALLQGMSILEVPMPYEERVGESKLRVVQDGFRFLKTILDALVCFRSEKLFFMFVMPLFVLGVLIGITPVEFYMREHHVEEWMIYRFVVSFFLGSTAYFLIGAGAVAHRLTAFYHPRRDGESFWGSLISSLFEGPPLWILSTFFVTASVSLLWPAITEFLSTGKVYLHWSRFMVGVFGFLIASQTFITAVFLYMVKLWGDQKSLPESLHELKTLPRHDFSRPAA